MPRRAMPFDLAVLGESLGDEPADIAAMGDLRASTRGALRFDTRMARSSLANPLFDQAV
jgi:hypothetical protein